jgi:hypothetical protein
MHFSGHIVWACWEKGQPPPFGTGGFGGGGAGGMGGVADGGQIEGSGGASRGPDAADEGGGD